MAVRHVCVCVCMEHARRCISRCYCEVVPGSFMKGTHPPV